LPGRAVRKTIGSSVGAGVDPSRGEFTARGLILLLSSDAWP